MNYPLRFIIFGIQRTGTIFLSRMLDSHPEILCIGEVFQDVDTPCHPELNIPRYRNFINASFVRKLKNRLMRHQTVKSYLDKVFSSYSFKAVGFKLMLNQLKLYPELMNYLRAHQFKVIHIVRNNILKTHISQIRATQTGLYVTKNMQQQIKVTIPSRTLFRNLDNLNKQNRQLRNYLKRMGIDSCTVVYEDLQQQRQGELQIILKFLDVDSSVVLSPKSNKITADDLIQVIENYNEIFSLLRNTKYERFVE